MIEPLDEEFRPGEYAALDVENRPDGSVFLAAGRVVGGELVEFRGDWCDFVEDFESFARSDRRWRTVYAHNGGGWDWLGLVRELIDRRRPFRAGLAGSNVVYVRVPSERKGAGITLLDSLRLVPLSLRDAAAKLGGSAKGELPALPWELWRRGRREEVREYLRGDVDACLGVVGSFERRVSELFPRSGRLGITAAATALRCWRSTLREPVAVPWSAAVRSFARRGYRGGRVEALRGAGEWRGINVYDCNSMYPSVMIDTPVPSSDRTRWTKRFDSDRPGVYLVEYRQPRGVPVILDDRGTGSREGLAYVYSPELLRLAEVGGEFRVRLGLVYLDSAVLFREYVSRLWGERRKDPDSPTGFAAKLLMNALYGKFGQRPERETIAVGDPRDGWTPLDDPPSVWSVTEERAADHEHVGIAGIITSEARARLHRAIEESGAVYCDTDSVHTPRRLPRSMLGRELGEWKTEERNVSAVYLGRKLYALRRSDGTEKVRAKGVRVKRKKTDELGAELGYDNLRSLLSGGELPVKFAGAPTIREVARGRRPCKWLERTRTLRITAPPAASTPRRLTKSESRLRRPGPRRRRRGSAGAG